MSGDLEKNVQQATDAINAGNFQSGLDLARTGLAINPGHAELKLIEAVALSQLNQRIEASQAFSHAINLDPGSAKAKYNAAVHEYKGGNLGLAQTLVTQTLQIDPRHEGALQLQKQMPTMSAETNYPRGQEYGFDNPGIGFINKLGASWNVIGWIISVIGASLFIYSLMSMAPYFSEMMKISASGGSPSEMNAITAKMQQSTFVQILGWVMIPVTMGYVLLDLIHRRGQMVWLIAHIPCSCCSMGFITLPIYMLFGRK
jgi:tetratricopeptide (TPR) repeat protein